MLRINTRISRILASYCIALLALACVPGAWAQYSAPPKTEEAAAPTAEVPAEQKEEKTTVELAPGNRQQVQGIKFKDERGGVLALKIGGPPLTIIHLWATWCAPCLEELPQVEAVYKAHRQKGLKVMAISLDGDNAKVRQFLNTNGLKTLLPLIDVNNASFAALQAKGLPTTAFFNDKGEMLARADGPLDWNSEPVKQLIESHAKKRGPNAHRY